MAEVKNLVQGYASRNGEKATSNCTLILDGELKIVVDPGMDREKLLKGLEENGLLPADINYVIQSHGHIDHAGLAGIFGNATIVDDEALYTFDGGFVEHHGKIPGSTIELIKTPGHDPNHFSVGVDTKNGKVVIAADVFWWYDEEEEKTDFDSLLGRHDEWAKDHEQLEKSRRKLLEVADVIIPGHGQMWKVR